VAPPLVKGRALLRRRIAGIVFLVVIALLVELSVVLYEKGFTRTVDVALETDRVGNQLSLHADVKVRGIVVGEVRHVSSNGERAVLQLALNPDRVGQIPNNVSAQLLPKTLFGEKEVTLVIPSDPSSEHVKSGDRITQDRSRTALETETALNDLLPLLKALEPQKLSLALDALSEGLRGRGDKLGRNLALTAAYFNQLNPSLPRLSQDMQGLADLANTYSDAAPDLLRTLDNLAFSGRSLVQQRTQLDAFLRSTRDFATSATSIVSDNEARLIALARDSVPSLQLYASYSDYYPCMLNVLAFQEIEGERVFGGGQPGLHITIEAIRDRDHGTYMPGADEPRYRDTYNPHCFGLDLKHIIRPFPAYRNPQDGYRDSDPPEDPGTGPKAGSWVPVTSGASSGDVVGTFTLPAGTTPFAALLLAPLTGSAT
jgi:phospholipid/cholesterol/gamma-HCH transport system substrate-binding protein